MVIIYYTANFGRFSLREKQYLIKRRLRQPAAATFPHRSNAVLISI